MVFKRILLKISGEYLAGSKNGVFDFDILNRLAKDISSIMALNIEVGVVIGGGNIIRGKSLVNAGIGRVTGDHMGLIGTVINGLAMADALERVSVPTKILSSIQMNGIADAYNKKEAISNLKQKKVVVFTGGTGNPLFTTDTGACLKGIEINADIVLKATKVNGVYSDDPEKNKNAEHYKKISYDEILTKNLAVMDLTAICLCKDNAMPLRVFNIDMPEALLDVAAGKDVGTFVYKGK